MLLLAALISGRHIDHLLGRWGYGLLFGIVALQSCGVPLPGTTALVAAALYAEATHRLAIGGVVLAAVIGAVLGSSVGFAIGRWGGWALLKRYGRYLRLTPDRLKTGRYIFLLHGGKVVVAGRFITGLRNWTGFLAGANRMPFSRFFGFTALSATLWALLNGAGYFYFGHAIRAASVAVDVALVAAGVAWIIGIVVYVRKRGATLKLAAEHAYPDLD